MRFNTHIVTRTQGVAWVSEYAGNDDTWKCYRTAYVMRKRRRMQVPR